MAALGSNSAGAATARLILGSAVTHGMADSFNRSWLVFADFCDSNGWPALPTTEAAVTCYFASMCDRGLKASTMKRYLMAVNSVHAAKGYPKSATGAHVVKLRKG